ncbi:hypothetical protein ACQUJS_16330 [Ralstonia pseudosolanacearum]|uniref:Uncharacterized protein n=1 Tax=Ralstonia solanacearum TaxID=305 RepID=A0A0S4U013_RALSL|nr:protein of unknown function [Ralstonia solanacearum]
MVDFASPEFFDTKIIDGKAKNSHLTRNEHRDGRLELKGHVEQDLGYSKIEAACGRANKAQ